MAHQFEHSVTLLDVARIESLHADKAEGFDVITRENTSINDGLPKLLPGDFAPIAARKITRQPAGKRIAGARRIMDVLQWIRAATEELVLPEKQTAVLAL